MTTAAPGNNPDIDGAPMQDLDPAPAVTRTGYRRPCRSARFPRRRRSQ
ncbi:hypothetical protein GS495_25290 [Rhodococcus hoagii]|nr:hypothetical protein [Prescottella equi]